MPMPQDSLLKSALMKRPMKPIRPFFWAFPSESLAPYSAANSVLGPLMMLLRPDRIKLLPLLTTPLTQQLIFLLLSFLNLLPPIAKAASPPSSNYYTSSDDKAQGRSSLSRSLLEMAIDASDCAADNFRSDHRFMGVIDYSLPSTTKRFWLINRITNKIELTDLVAHGRNSGDNHAEEFSNESGSLKSSLGLFSTGSSYWGQHGYSLRLYGLEPGINDAAFDRAIVMHGADYVSESFINRWHRLGRSFGCPALPNSTVSTVIDRLKNGAPLFAYYPDSLWLDQSPFLKGCRGKTRKLVRLTHSAR